VDCYIWYSEEGPGCTVALPNPSSLYHPPTASVPITVLLYDGPLQWRSQEFDLGGYIYVLTSHCNVKTCVNVPHVNKTINDFGGIYTDIPPPVAMPLVHCSAVLMWRLKVNGNIMSKFSVVQILTK